MSPMSRAFVTALEKFVVSQDVPLVALRKGERKDTVMAAHLRNFSKQEGVVFVGKPRRRPLCSAPRSAEVRRPVSLTPGS
jgi:hypothetical protein